MVEFTGWPEDSVMVKECYEVHECFFSSLMERAKKHGKGRLFHTPTSHHSLPLPPHPYHPSTFAIIPYPYLPSFPTPTFHHTPPLPPIHLHPNTSHMEELFYHRTYLPNPWTSSIITSFNWEPYVKLAFVPNTLSSLNKVIFVITMWKLFF